MKSIIIGSVLPMIGGVVCRCQKQMSFYNLDFLWVQLIPRNSVYRLFRELASLLIQPEDLVSLYCLDNGRPSNPVLQMTLACLLQQMNDVSDRDMEIQTRVNMELEYALAMSMEQPGISFVNFYNHRQRLIPQHTNLYGRKGLYEWNWDSNRKKLFINKSGMRGLLSY